VRRHAVKNRSRDGERRRHQLCVSFVEAIDVLVYCRQRIFRAHFVIPLFIDCRAGAS
jgi:hypothetical protein